MHQGNISYAGFNGSGYVITDPETGAGAYKISTGASGSVITLILALLVALSLAFFQLLLIVYAAPLCLLAATAGAIFLGNLVVNSYLTDLQKVDVASLRFVGILAIAVALVLAAGFVTLALSPVIFSALAFLYALITLALDLTLTTSRVDPQRVDPHKLTLVAELG